MEALAAASEEEVQALWAGLGYYQRARSMHQCLQSLVTVACNLHCLCAGAKQVLKQHGGQLPSTARELEELPGIGPYTAGPDESMRFPSLPTAACACACVGAVASIS